MRGADRDGGRAAAVARGVGARRRGSCPGRRSRPAWPVASWASSTSLNGVAPVLLLARDRASPRSFMADLALYFVASNGDRPARPARGGRARVGRALTGLPGVAARLAAGELGRHDDRPAAARGRLPAGDARDRLRGGRRHGPGGLAAGALSGAAAAQTRASARAAASAPRASSAPAAPPYIGRLGGAGAAGWARTASISSLDALEPGVEVVRGDDRRRRARAAVAAGRAPPATATATCSSRPAPDAASALSAWSAAATRRSRARSALARVGEGVRLREVLAGQRAVVRSDVHGGSPGEEWAERERKRRAHPGRVATRLPEIHASTLRRPSTGLRHRVNGPSGGSGSELFPYIGK